MSGEGFWRVRNGKREWVPAPRCRCGGECDKRTVADMEDANEGDVLAEVFCLDCGSVQVSFLKPTAESVERGRELAERYGW